MPNCCGGSEPGAETRVAGPRVGCGGLATRGSGGLRGLRGLWDRAAGSKSELCRLPSLRSLGE